jgi:hypothetical protein
MDLRLWGNTISKTNNMILIRKKGSQYIYNIEIIDIPKKPLTYNITLRLPTQESFISFTDIQNKEFKNLNTFTRYIGPNEYYFVDGILELRVNPRRTSFLEAINIHKNKFGKKIVPSLDNKFLTLDIETPVISSVHGEEIVNIIKPILISIYDGLNHFNFYLPDFNSVDDMINSALNTLLNPKYDKYKIYVHNLSNFDGIFLMKY